MQWNRDKALFSESRLNGNNKFKSWEETKSIGVLYDFEDMEVAEWVERMAAAWKSEQRRIFNLAFKNEKKKKSTLLDQGHVYYSNELDFRGRPKSGEVGEFLNRSYDILIHFGTYKSPNAFLVNKVNAGLLIGVNKEDWNPYDLIIYRTSDLTQWTNNLVEYLKRIQHV